MNSDQRLHERFNLNNYRHPSQRRQSNSSAIPPQQQLSLNTPILRPVAPAPAPPSPVVIPERTATKVYLHSVGSSRDMYRDLPPAPARDMFMAPLVNSHTGSLVDQPVVTNSNPFALFDAFSSGLRTAPAPAPTQMTAPPPPTPPAAPTNATLIRKLLEKMDILAARQETVFKYFKEALIARLADSEEPKDKKQDTDNSKIVETTTSTAKAVAGLAHRIDTLTQDMSTIRQVLGIRAKSTEREETDAAKYIKRERLTRAITTGKPSGVAAGGSPSNAIDIDGLDETSGPGEDGAKGEEQNVVAAQRTIIDRLDSMEMDFAEFMERVRDPDANVDGLRGQSSFSNAAAKQRKRVMQDVGISPRTPSPPLVAHVIQLKPTRHESPPARVHAAHQGVDSTEVVTPQEDNTPSVARPDAQASLEGVPSQPTNISSPTLSDKEAFNTFLEDLRKDIIVLSDSVSTKDSQSDRVPSSGTRHSTGERSSKSPLKKRILLSKTSPERRDKVKRKHTPSPSARSTSVEMYSTAEASSPVDGDDDGDDDDERPLKRLKRWSSPSRPTRTKARRKRDTAPFAQNRLNSPDNNTPGTSERERSKTIWVSKPSTDTFRDLREVRIGPPRKSKPTESDASSYIVNRSSTRPDLPQVPNPSHTSAVDRLIATFSGTVRKTDFLASDRQPKKKKRRRPVHTMDGEQADTVQSSQSGEQEALQGGASGKRAVEDRSSVNKVRQQERSTPKPSPSARVRSGMR